MTREGWTHITIPKTLHEKLKLLARQNRTSIHEVINTGVNTKTNPENTAFQKTEWGWEDLNSRPERPRLINWNLFLEWLHTNHCHEYSLALYSYARKYSHLLLNGDVSLLGGFSKGKRRQVMIALANLSKFLGCYKEWQELKNEAGLKWPRQTAIEAFLSIMNVDLAETKDWLKECVEKLPEEYSRAIVFDLATGLRIGEACKSINLLSEVSNYFNEEFSMLEHWKFPGLFLRRTKNAYISFVPKDLVMREISPLITVDRLKKALRKHGLPNRLMSIRKLHGTVLRESSIPSEVVDLLHGRISESVFLRHYYRPDILHDIREKVLKAIKPAIRPVLD